MIAVIFEVWPHPERRQAYLNLAADLRHHLETIDGFISVERFESLSEPGKLLSLSFWRDEAGGLDISYGLAVALISIGIIAAFSGMSGMARFVAERVGAALSESVATFGHVMGEAPTWSGSPLGWGQ